MRTERFKAVIESVASMTEAQLDRLVEAVEQRRVRTKALRILESARDASKCLHCGSPTVVKNGHSCGLQRYRCRTCKRTFNATTGTPLAGLHSKERFFQQGACLAEGLTVREAAAELGVATSTAFRLRHRFLTAVVAHQPTNVSGLLEADETYFRESQKGVRGLRRKARARGGKAEATKSKKDLVPVLVGQVRGSHQVVDRVLKAMTADQAADALRSVVGPDTLLCTDGSGAFRKAAAELGVTAKSIAVSYDGRVQGVYHVQTVNNYHQRLKGWVNGSLRGVATKYMPNYLAWMRLGEWFKDQGAKPEHFVLSGLGQQLINR